MSHPNLHDFIDDEDFEEQLRYTEKITAYVYDSIIFGLVVMVLTMH